MIKMAQSFLDSVANQLNDEPKKSFHWNTVWALRHHIDALEADIERLQQNVVQLDSELREMRSGLAEDHIIREHKAFVAAGDCGAAQAIEMVLTWQGKTDLLERMGAGPRPFPS